MGLASADYFWTLIIDEVLSGCVCLIAHCLRPQKPMQNAAQGALNNCMYVPCPASGLETCTRSRSREPVLYKISPAVKNAFLAKVLLKKQKKAQELGKNPGILLLLQQQPDDSLIKVSSPGFSLQTSCLKVSKEF